MLETFDFNLLVQMNVLFEEKNVSRAAERLHISQPALSNALGRARVILKDPLLVRSGQSMILTPFAKKIQVPLNQAMTHLTRHVLFKKDFDPKKDTYNFMTAFRGYEEVILLPSLLEKISSFKGLSLKNQKPSKLHAIEDLCKGFIHFTITPKVRDHEGILQKKILTDHFVCVVQKDFPKNEITIDDYCSSHHLLISLHGGKGMIDDDLEKIGKSRFIKITVGEFGSAPILISRSSSLITTVPEKIASLWKQHYPVKIINCPFEMKPIKLYLSYHSSSQYVPELMWFKELIEEVVGC